MRRCLAHRGTGPSRAKVLRETAGAIRALPRICQPRTRRAAVDPELAIVRQLNQTFGTAHTRLDQFTAKERAMIEQALGQKFN